MKKVKINFKYTAYLIKRKVQYLNISDGSLAYPTDTEKLLSGFNGSAERFIFTELFQKIGMVQADTLTDLEIKCCEFAEQINDYDFQTYTIRKSDINKTKNTAKQLQTV